MSANATPDLSHTVLPVSALPPNALAAIFNPHGLYITWVAPHAEIPGSYWKESEAGLIGNHLYLRPDTPVHSALHEGCHWLLASPDRRANMHTDALSGDVEEHAVCYLQCLLSHKIAGYSYQRCCADMDAWGYNFALGSTQAFYEKDSADAQAFLRANGWM